MLSRTFGLEFQFFQIDIGLVEAIEQHQAVGAGLVQPLRHVRHVAEEWAELDRDRNRHRRLHRLQDVEIGLFDVAADDRSGSVGMK